MVFVRSIISFFSLLIFAKILGKQQISQLTFFDYVLGITIGNIAGTLATDLSTRAWPHFVGLFTWALLGYSMEYITMKWRSAAKYIDGEPVVIIINGKIMENALRRLKYRTSDIIGLLRNKDIFDLSQIDFAIIETNGQLSVLKKAEHEPLTAKDMNISKSPVSINIDIIYDGILIEHNLKKINKDKNWLLEQLKSQGIKDISEVFLATSTPSGSLYVDKYADYMEGKLYE